MLRLPAFLISSSVNAHPRPEDIADGFRLTGFFLARDVYEPRGIAIPDARDAYVSAVKG